MKQLNLVVLNKIELLFLGIPILTAVLSIYSIRISQKKMSLQIRFRSKIVFLSGAQETRILKENSNKIFQKMDSMTFTVEIFNRPINFQLFFGFFWENQKFPHFFAKCSDKKNAAVASQNRYFQRKKAQFSKNHELCGQKPCFLLFEHRSVLTTI